MAKALEEPAAPAKGRKLGWVILTVICLAAAGGGFAVPLLLNSHASAGGSGEHEHKPAAEQKLAWITFGDMVVNVADGNFSRYLRVKMILVVDEKDEKAVAELVNKHKPELQDWVNGYLSDQTLKSLHGSAGKNRIRREIRDRFNAKLFPDGSEKIKELLMPEFNFQ